MSYSARRSGGCFFMASHGTARHKCRHLGMSHSMLFKQAESRRTVSVPGAAIARVDGDQTMVAAKVGWWGGRIASFSSRADLGKRDLEDPGKSLNGRGTAKTDGQQQGSTCLCITTRPRGGQGRSRSLAPRSPARRENAAARLRSSGVAVVPSFLELSRCGRSSGDRESDARYWQLIKRYVRCQ